MSKTAFVFPGQGSQSVGMGKELYDSFAEVRELYDTADKILGMPLSKLCFEGPEEELRLTVNTQPALFTTCVACLRMLEKKGVKADATAGHSIGEYAALVAAGALQFEQGLVLVRRRAELMQKAAEENPGTMAAVIGLDTDAVRAVCEKASSAGIVDVANYNSPGQVVISGEVKGVEAASEYAKEAGAKRVLPLNVSGGFHSKLMQSAADGLRAALQDADISDAVIPVVANVTAGYVTKAEEIKDCLARQVAGSVQWDKSIALMSADGVTRFVEVGPGKVLAGLIKRIAEGVEVVNVSDSASLADLA